MKISEIKNFDDSTIHNLLTTLVKNVNSPYEKVFVERTKENLDVETIVGKIKSRDTHLSYYIHAVCEHLLKQNKKKDDANTIIEEIVRRLITLFEQKTADYAKDNELLKKENVLLKDSLKLIKGEHEFLKIEIAGALSNLKIEATPPQEEPRRRFN
ncbi:MAG: hypothetical protein Q7S22_00440 [Candidatus Micrarchaeota archaeon]|nr:hypothetical protein [Candidatus Micrarchaeota archaeon]